MRKYIVEMDSFLTNV